MTDYIYHFTPSSLAADIYPDWKSGILVLEPDIKEWFRQAYEKGWRVRSPWYKRIFGKKWERVKLPDRYKELFDG